MKIRNIPQKPFLTVDSDMKSSNFEIKLKVFQHKKKTFCPSHYQPHFPVFYYSVFFFAFFFIIPFFFYFVLWFHLALLLYKMRQCRLNGTTCWWKYTEGYRMNETLVLVYGNSFLFVFFHLLWLRSFLSVKRIWMQSEMWVCMPWFMSTLLSVRII